MSYMFLNFQQFSQKDRKKFRMAKIAVTIFFLTIFPKETGINLEWPKMAIPNFFLTIFPRKTGMNLEWPKMAILNFFQQLFSKRLDINLEWPKIVEKNSEQPFLTIPNFPSF